jgi:general secretion pathway protein D
MLKTYRLDTPLIKLKYYTILQQLLLPHNIEFIIENNLLKISSINTKTFHLDYLNFIRVSQSNTDINISNKITNLNKNIKNSSKNGSQISSKIEFDFWKNLYQELLQILNRPEDWYKNSSIIVNSYAGLVTITGTDKQLNRMEKYIKLLNSKIQKQVILDVVILSIEFNDEEERGLNWRQLQSIFDFNIDFEMGSSSEVVNSKIDIFKISKNISMDNLYRHFKEFGDVKVVSNPQIIALHNQTAIISVGEQIYYKRTQTTTSTSNHTTTNQNEIVESIFSGVLLDITPTITNHQDIILRINPSISSIKDKSIKNDKTLPPDLIKKQLSTIVKVTNNQKIILGGLISTKNINKQITLPIIENIPILKEIFSYTLNQKKVQEMIVIITPHLV